MTLPPDSARPATRRDRRAREARATSVADSDAATPDTATSAAPASISPEHVVDAAPEVPVESTWADASRPPTALAWVDAAAVETASVPTPQADEDPDYRSDLLEDARLLPGWLRPRVLVPIGIVALLCGSYAATTLLWPLTEVAPEVSVAPVEVAPAPASEITWPRDGVSAVGVEGLSTLASSTEQDEIASITKVVSVLMVLDELPLKAGEQGPSFEFDYGDATDFWRYLGSNQSALDVPVGGSLTEYQMLQGILLGSANNYIDRLSDELWGDDQGFQKAAQQWLRGHGIDGVTLYSPSGFDTRNVATPSALIEVGKLAMQNPVIAEIVGSPSAEIPGVGTVKNTNGMLADAGVIGVKTGTLSGWNLLTAKDVTVGDTTVRLFSAVLGQPSDADRLAVTRSLFAQVEAQLADQKPVVPAGTTVGRVETLWGDDVAIVTDADLNLLLWNGATATAGTSIDLGGAIVDGEPLPDGADVGAVTVSGPLGVDETTVSLTGAISAPSPWWRLTHPLELFGIDRS